jgi:hypothetical protein
MISIEIGIPNIGIDAGPFDLYSDVDSFTTAFETGITKTEMEQGFISNNAPDNSTIIRVQSTGVCDNYSDIEITAQPTTTTSTTTTSTTTTSTTTTTTLPPTTTSTTTTSTTLPPTTTTTSTTSTTTLNRILTITNVTFNGSQFRVFFEPTNFTLSALVYEISNDAVNWYTPDNYIDIDTTSPQVFNPGLYFESFYIRIFDNDSGIVTYSDPFLYTDPVTTSTTTTTQPVGEFHMIQMSNGLGTNPFNPCSSTMNISKHIYTTQPNLGQYPLPGDIVCNTPDLNDRFSGGTQYYRMVYSFADVNQQSIVARVDNNGLIYSQLEICPAQINPE